MATILLGNDEKWGGDKGLIDFLRPSEWGKGKKKKKKTKTKKGKTAADKALEDAATGKATKAKGGVVKKAKGGAVKTAAKKTSTKRSKPRGVGAAKRGYGKAMR